VVEEVEEIKGPWNIREKRLWEDAAMKRKGNLPEVSENE